MTTGHRFLSAALLVALMASTIFVGKVGISKANETVGYEVSALPAVPFIEAVSLQYREAVADLCWMQAVQYYGEHRQGGNDLSEFGHFLDAVNTLSPLYEHAYLLGAVVLATDGADFPQAMQVLRRGSQALPQSYSIPFHMGFRSFVANNDPQAAASWFGYAARWPQGRQRALRFQAFMSRKLGNPERAWALWQDVLQTTEDESMRIIARESIKKLEAELRARRSAT